MVYEVPKARFNPGHIGIGFLGRPDEVPKVDSMHPGVRHGTIMFQSDAWTARLVGSVPQVRAPLPMIVVGSRQQRPMAPIGTALPY